MENASAKIGLALTIALIATGYFFAFRSDFRPAFQPDSKDYIEMSDTQLFSREGLSSYRTIGYPLFLQVMHRASGGWDLVPVVQWFAYVSSILLLFLSIIPYGVPKFAAALVCSLLLFSDMTRGIQHAFLCTDSLALSLAVLTMASLLLAVKSSRFIYWFCLAAFSFLTMQVRPAYIFLIPLVPVVSFLLQSDRLGIQLPIKNRIQRSLGLMATVTVPFLLFCSLRWSLVNDFRLVSFGGSCLFGLTGQILTPDMVQKLPETLRGPAQFVIEQREIHPAAKNYVGGKWTSPLRGRFNIFRKDMQEYQWFIGGHVGWFALKDAFGFGEVEVNKTLEALSWAIIKLNPIPYLVWIVKSFFGGFNYAWNSATFLYPTIAALFLFLLNYVFSLAKNNRQILLKPFSEGENRLIHLCIILAVPFFVFKIFLTALVNPAISRYSMPAMIFLPMIPVALALALLRQVFSFRNQPN